MNGKMKRLSAYGLMGLLLLTGVLCPNMIAFAGGINGNEASVIAAASGTFTYDGKTYRAGSAYINELISSLSADDVDLTAEQASEAISTMYASVAQGIADGYLYEVTDSSTTESSSTESGSTESGTTENRSTEDASIETGEAENNGNKDYSEKSDKNKSDKKDKDKKDSIEDNKTESEEEKVIQTENEKILETRPEKKEATATVHLKKKNIVVTTKDNKEISISKKGQILSKKFLCTANLVTGLVLVVTIICAVILFTTKCMSFKRPKNRRARPGHSKRRKIRRHTRNVLTVTTAFSFLGVFLMFAIYISLFNENAIMQNMQSSGYFRYAYSEYKEEDREENEDLKSYEEYRFFIKQNSLKILNGETNIRIPDSNVTPYIYNLKSNFQDLFRTAGSFIMISLVLGMILMIFMDQRRERGIKHTAFAELLASIGFIVAAVIMAAAKPYLNVYIELDYLYLFLTECIHWTVKVMTGIAAFGVVVGMILIGVYRTFLRER